MGLFAFFPLPSNLSLFPVTKSQNPSSEPPSVTQTCTRCRVEKPLAQFLDARCRDRVLRLVPAQKRSIYFAATSRVHSGISTILMEDVATGAPRRANRLTTETTRTAA